MASKAKKPALDYKTQIAERLKKAREGLGFTQQQVADKAGVSRSAVVHYEKANVVPGGQELIGLAKALKLTPNFILSGSEGFFDSTAPEHALAVKDEPEHLRAARVALCIQALDREVAEAVSALLMVLVKAKLPKNQHTALMKTMEGISRTVAGMVPDIDAMVDNATAAGAFHELEQSLGKKPRGKARPKK